MCFKKTFYKPILTYLFMLLFVGCVYSTEEIVSDFENRLESFMGKNMREVVLYFGQPTRYYNTKDTPNSENDGTYMVYDYRKKNNDCVIMIKYAKTTLKIIDWDYEGNCALIRNPLFFKM